MKYAVLLLLLLFIICGCTEAPTALVDAETSAAETGSVETGSVGAESVESQPKAKAKGPWGGLKVETRGAPLAESTQVVVLLHGYGTTNADLVPFADRLAAEGRAFVFPAAPVELDSGGLAWATTQSEIETSSQALQDLLAFVHETHPNSKISVGGFSQGASMSSLLVDSKTPLQHVILFSPGLMLKDVQKTSGTGPAVYISHGRQDKVLPFSDAQKLKDMLSNAGCEVKLSAFDGGHAIPANVLSEAKAQLDIGR